MDQGKLQIEEVRLKTAQDSHFEGGLNYWLASKVALVRILIEKKVFSQAEWNQKVEEVLKEINEREEK